MIPVLRAWNRRVWTPAAYGHCVHALLGEVWIRFVQQRAASLDHPTVGALMILTLLAFGALAIVSAFREDADLKANFWNGLSDILAWFVVSAWELDWKAGVVMDLGYLISVHFEGRKLLSESV